MNRARWVSLLFAALLAWTSWAFALELYRSFWLWSHDPWLLNQPSTWRITTVHVARLRDFLTPISRLLPPGQRIAVISEPGPETERFFRFLWVAYLLPQHRVKPFDERAELADVEVVLTVGLRWQDPRLEVLYEAVDGAAYRVRRASE